MPVPEKAGGSRQCLSDFIGKPWYLMVGEIVRNDDLFQMAEFVHLGFLTAQVTGILAFHFDLLLDRIGKRLGGGARTSRSA